MKEYKRAKLLLCKWYYKYEYDYERFISTKSMYNYICVSQESFACYYFVSKINYISFCNHCSIVSMNRWNEFFPSVLKLLFYSVFRFAAQLNSKIEIASNIFCKFFFSVVKSACSFFFCSEICETIQLNCWLFLNFRCSILGIVNR